MHCMHISFSAISFKKKSHFFQAVNIEHLNNKILCQISNWVKFPFYISLYPIIHWWPDSESKWASTSNRWSDEELHFYCITEERLLKHHVSRIKVYAKLIIRVHAKLNKVLLLLLKINVIQRATGLDNWWKWKFSSIVALRKL